MRRTLGWCVLGFLAGCGGEEQTEEQAPFAEMWENGADRYLGAFEPEEQTEQDGVVTSTFSVGDGPMCLRGTPYTVSTREGSDDRLFLFMQGGGACWSDFCLAIESAPGGIPAIHVLREDYAANPMADFDLVYMPYCDGSLFVGDRDIDDDGDGTMDRMHRGLMNLSAALDVAVDTFPNPPEVVLAGSSGGGYGTILAATLIRRAYPNATIRVFNDSGVGLGDPVDVDFIPRLLEEFGADHLVPDSCEECFASGHSSQLLQWELDQDPNLEIAAYSSKRDIIIGDVFLGVGADTFEAELLAETSGLVASGEGRFQRFVVNGASHTVLIGDVNDFLGGDIVLPPPLDTIVVMGTLGETAVDGVTAGEWMRRFVEGEDGWTSLVEP